LQQSLKRSYLRYPDNFFISALLGYITFVWHFTFYVALLMTELADDVISYTYNSLMMYSLCVNVYCVLDVMCGSRSFVVFV